MALCKEHLQLKHLLLTGWVAPMNIFHIPPTDFELKFPFEGMNEARDQWLLHFCRNVASHPVTPHPRLTCGGWLDHLCALF